DFTICDFVADLRAPTPTAAATLVVPDRAVILHKIEGIGRRIVRCADHALATRMQRLDHTSRRLIHPAARLAQRRDHARALAERLDRAWRVELAGGQGNGAQIAPADEVALTLARGRALATITRSDGGTPQA